MSSQSPIQLITLKDTGRRLNCYRHHHHPVTHYKYSPIYKNDKAQTFSKLCASIYSSSKITNVPQYIYFMYGFISFKLLKTNKTLAASFSILNNTPFWIHHTNNSVSFLILFVPAFRIFRKWMNFSNLWCFGFTRIFIYFFFQTYLPKFIK